MRVHIKNTETQKIHMNVQGNDWGAGVPKGHDLAKDVVYVEVIKQAVFDENTQRLSVIDPVFLDAPHPDYKDYNQYVIEYEVEQLSDDEILENLKNAYIAHKNEQYPEYTRERDKDRRDDILFRLVSGVEVAKEETTAQLVIAAWQKQISAEYEAQKAEFINDGTTPSFTFTDRP